VADRERCGIHLFAQRGDDWELQHELFSITWTLACVVRCLQYSILVILSQVLYNSHARYGLNAII
jgi:hypothetical protein